MHVLRYLNICFTLLVPQLTHQTFIDVPKQPQLQRGNGWSPELKLRHARTSGIQTSLLIGTAASHQIEHDEKRV